MSEGIATVLALIALAVASAGDPKTEHGSERAPAVAAATSLPAEAGEPTSGERAALTDDAAPALR